MKKITSILLLVFLLTSMAFTTAEASTEDHLIIEHIYGGGGKGETPISNSFIELYNPTESEIELSGYSVTDGTQTLALDGKISAKGSYLIIGSAESTTEEYLTYTLPEPDKICDWAINNKSYTIKLMNGETEVDSVTAGGSDETKVSKQKSLRRANHGDFALVVWEKTKVTVDEAYVTANAPRNSKGEYGSVYGAVQEPLPSYIPVQTSDVRVKGYFNADDTIKLEISARYNSGAMNADGGSLEIVAYNPENGYAYAVSGVKGKLIAVDLNCNTDGDTVKELNGTEYDVKALVNGFAYGDMTSVSVSPDGKKIAVAIQAENYANKGIAALFSCADNGALTLLSTVEVGVQPDMITFADNETILTADEGEPREGTKGADPKGSVTVIKIGNENTLTANSVYFDIFDAKREELTSKGVLIQKNTQPSTDFEPEYIAVSGNTAYISLQEANAIAVLDITSKTFKDIYPLGFQDYGVIKVDMQKNDAIELKNYPNVYGIKMPDGISVTEIGDKTYLLTANEGDSRADWEGLDNESEGKTSPNSNVTLDSKVVWFNTAMWDGLDSDKSYVFGGRSFSIYEVTDNGLTLVFDSRSEFEEITADKLADYFNASNDKISLDNRSGKKGPEPESVITGVIGNKTFAFVALERIGGIMVYDITDPANAKFANYINSREFDEAIKGDVSPEGLCFISAENSKTGKATLLAACEVSGTLAVYECDYKAPHTHNYGTEWKFDAENHWKECTCGDKADIMTHTGGEATCSQKAICPVCCAEYGEVNPNNHKLTFVKAENAAAAKDGNIEYYYCEYCGKYFSDNAGTKEISKEDTVITKLAPKIIEGNNITIDKSSKEPVSFCSDAVFADFIRVELDGKELVKDKDYTLKDSNITVTLAPEFVATLSSGEYKLGIVSVSGTATANFTVTENEDEDTSSDIFPENDSQKSPQTDDKTPIGFLIALMLLSGCALFGLTICGKKRESIYDIRRNQNKCRN